MWSSCWLQSHGVTRRHKHQHTLFSVPEVLLKNNSQCKKEKKIFLQIDSEAEVINKNQQWKKNHQGNHMCCQIYMCGVKPSILIFISGPVSLLYWPSCWSNFLSSILSLQYHCLAASNRNHWGCQKSKLAANNEWEHLREEANGLLAQCGKMNVE